MSANFTPSQSAIQDLKPFRFWCQKVLPTVYDDSLSYYELLTKVVNYLNDTIDNVETLNDNVQNIYDAYILLQNYVNNYFDQNFPQLVSDKLDEMAEDGTLTALISAYIDPYFEEKSDEIDEAIESQNDTISEAISDQNGVLSAQTSSINQLTSRMDAFINQHSGLAGETVLYNGNGTPAYTTGSYLALSDALANYKYLRFVWKHRGEVCVQDFEIDTEEIPAQNYNLRDTISAPPADSSGSASWEMCNIVVINATSGSTNQLELGGATVIDNFGYNDGPIDGTMNTGILKVIGIKDVSDTEVVDARVGADGTIYPNLEARLNAENSELKNALDYNGESNETQISFSSDSGKLINKNTGAVTDTSSTTYYVSRPISVTPGDKYKANLNMRYDNGVIAFYNGDNVVSVISASTAGNGASPNFEIRDYVFTVPTNTVTMRIAFYNYNDVHTLHKVGSFVIYSPNWKGKKWVCVGDSLTAENSATTKHYFDFVSDITGISVVNMGADGTGYAKSSGSGSAFYNRVSNVPIDADVVTIFGSFNDLSSGLEIGTPTDTGTSTIAGCINTTITNLQSHMPLVNLGIVAPTPWKTARPNFVETSNSYKYVNMLEQICKLRSIPFLNLWYCSNLRPWESSFLPYAYSNDGDSGVHPNEEGHKLIAGRFKAFIESLIAER